MAEYCRSIFGDALLIDPLDKYPVGGLGAVAGHGGAGEDSPAGPDLSVPTSWPQASPCPARRT